MKMKMKKIPPRRPVQRRRGKSLPHTRTHARAADMPTFTVPPTGMGSIKESFGDQAIRFSGSKDYYERISLGNANQIIKER